MANIIESRVTLEDEVFEENIDTAEEPIEVVRPSSYNDLQDLPQVNGVTLQGNKTSSDLGIVTQNDINSAVSAEATLRENADTALGGRIDQEITDRGNADTALGGRIDGEITNRQNADIALGTRIDNEILARQGGDNNLQTQIDAITSKSDVVDVVATYADLQAYDTQHLGNNDVIKVLDDETHDHSQTYYRWNKPNSTWAYIGSEAPYYSKSQIDTQMAQKQDKLVAGSNIQIASDGKTISATDTTYTAGTGLELNGTEFSADTTVLATKTEVAPKLQTEVVAELPTTGEESKLYLTPKNYTTGTASGNPITISLGEDAGQITSAQLDGDTYQQSYTGKNLFSSTLEDGYYSQSTGEKVGSSSEAVRSATPSAVQASTQYCFSVNGTIYATGFRLFCYKPDMTFISTTTTSTGTFTTPAECGYVNFHSTGLKTSYPNNDELIQIELGSTATSYEPYCGGVPSPNPDYPQQIQTVMGTQTVSINGTDYPISLGSIELCKLGDYQDYIYKSGSDWKIARKVLKRQFNGSDTDISANGWVNSGTSTAELQNSVLNVTSLGIAFAGQSLVLSDRFYYVASSANYADGAISTSSQTSGALRFVILCLSRIRAADIDGAKSWIASHKPLLYAPLMTPTDTTITDQTLIAQLEAVRNATLQASNTITNTATGTNLAGDLELGYYEYDPQNRYDKWLWLDLNNNYEKLGS